MSTLLDACVWFAFPGLSQEKRPQTKSPARGKVSCHQPPSQFMSFYRRQQIHNQTVECSLTCLSFVHLFFNNFIGQVFFSCLLYLLQFYRIDPAVHSIAEPHVQADTLAQTDPVSHPLSAWRVNKNSSFPDEIELRNLLHKLSARSLETQHITALGDTDSLSSHTSG